MQLPNFAQLKRLLMALLLVIYVAISAVAINVLTTKDYEWMADDKDTDVTLCTLPAPNDDMLDLAIPIAFIVVAPSLIVGIVHARGRRLFNPALIAGLGLLLYLAYRVFGRTLMC